MHVIAILLAFVLLGSEGDFTPDSQQNLTNVLPFICNDGTKLELSKVCDGLPHCPDSSDELTKLCHHVVCPISYYRCRYGACVPRKNRCDGYQDCVDGSDEFACDQQEICTDREFRCLGSNSCVFIAKICNGNPDCPDGSDESEDLCKDHTCPSQSFRCTYGGCINRETVCDGAKDCLDGSDEVETMCASINCQGVECQNFSCSDDEFRCESGGQCIPRTKVCDGTHQCRDVSDEKPEMCLSRKCEEGFYRCKYGGCIPEALKCNFRANCLDWSDEEESLCGASLPDGACRLPPARPVTHYRVSDCEECRPGQVVPELTRLDYTCDPSTSLEGSSRIYCRNNVWSPAVPRCISESAGGISCLAVEAPGALKMCRALWGQRQGWIECNSSLPVGTHVTLECPEYYERESGSSHTTCLHDGTWSQKPLKCRPICGLIENPSVATLIVKGWTPSPEEAFPWHATLFSHENGTYKFFCGGTLISERAVLTAGHCVWKTDDKTVKIALAMFSSNFSEMHHRTQTFNVEKIYLQTSYQDHEGNYGSDAAVLVLDRPAIINSFVRPVCLDRSRSNDVEQRIGEIAYVAGLGITENDTFSAKLRITSMKLVDQKTCRESQSRDFRKYVTYTSFCAGWGNGSSVCNGDSGGGLFLKNPGNSTIWELHGIVSISPRKIGTSYCDPHFYAIFTKVSSYIDWIFEILDAFPVLGTSVERRPNRDDVQL